MISWNSMGRNNKVGHDKFLSLLDSGSPPLGTKRNPIANSAPSFCAWCRAALRSARLLDTRSHHALRLEEFRVFFVPEVLAGAERAELARERTQRSFEFLRVAVHSHEQIMAGEPAPRDDLRHRTSPCTRNFAETTRDAAPGSIRVNAPSA